MTKINLPKPSSQWSGPSGELLTVQAVWNPNEEQDPWVNYTDQDGLEYSCRVEAFVSRFRSLAP
jgi:hypothetical protein